MVRGKCAPSIVSESMPCPLTSNLLGACSFADPRIAPFVRRVTVKTLKREDIAV